MPRTRSDYRAARAVLSAPYPLPVVITRNAPPRAPNPAASQTNQILTEPPAASSTYHGFSIFNERWRDLPPAIPPIPYPPQDTLRTRTWKVKLRRPTKPEGEESEMEVMSGIEEGRSAALDITRTFGECSFRVPSVSHNLSTCWVHALTEKKLSATPQHNLLTSVFESKIPRTLFDQPTPQPLFQPHISTRQPLSTPIDRSAPPSRPVAGPSRSRNPPRSSPIPPSSAGSSDSDVGIPSKRLSPPVRSAPRIPPY